MTDTTLFTEVETPRTNGTVTRVTTTVTNDTVQVVATRTAGGTETITNVGTFDAATAGNLQVKADFTGVVLNASDSIQFTIGVQF